MSRFLRWYQNLGVDARVPAREVRFVRASNGLVLGVSLLLLLQIPATITLLPESRYILASFVVAPLLWQLVPLLNHHGRYTAARVWFSTSCIVIVAFNAVQIGRESDNHLFMISVFLSAFFIFPPRQGAYIAAICVAAALAMAGLEVYFIDHPSVLDAPPEFFRTARLLSVSALFAVILFTAVHNYRMVDRAEDLLEEEHRRSEGLLLNVLPPSIAARLKRQERVIADRVEDATVLFADLVDFTELSGRLPAERVVEVLNGIFSAFDRICERHGLEKIKTIGDAYMLAGGIPLPRPDHCEAVVDCAVEMLAYVDSLPAPAPRVRIGVHAGPVVAGVIGERRFAYDLWGDTVNTAARLESHGETGRIQVSRGVRDRLLGERYRFEPRGTVTVKGKGDMELYFVTSPAPAPAPAPA
jgi:adenylate cyclase